MVAAMVGWKDAEAEFIAHAGVGGIAGRPLQIGSVLDGQNKFVERGGVGVFLRGAVLGSALGVFADLFGGPKGVARGLECGGFGIRPALLLEQGQVRGVFHRAKHDVAPAKKRAEIIFIVDANLKFLMQFHGLSGKGEFGGLGGLRHELVQRVQALCLRSGEVAEFAFGSFLVGDIAGQFGAKIIGGRDIGGVQSGADFGMRLGGGDDEAAVVGEDGNGHMRAFHF